MIETRKTARARYTLEFKQEAVRPVESGQSIAAAARRLGLAEQTLCNWVNGIIVSKISFPYQKFGYCSRTYKSVTFRRFFHPGKMRPKAGIPEISILTSGKIDAKQRQEG